MRGQALVEFSAVFLIVLILAFGLIDYSRAIYEKQVITNLSREGSNLASRGTSLQDTAQALVDGSAPLDLTAHGLIIITEVSNDDGVVTITDQYSRGAISGGSRIGAKGKAPTLPTTALQLPQPNQRLYVTEIFYAYQSVTPVGKLINTTMPTTMYDVAYF